MKFLEKSEVHRILKEVISDGILIVNDQQIIVASNVVTDRMFGYSEGELAGKPLETLVPKDKQGQHRGDAGAFIKKGQRRRMGQGMDLVGLQKDGGEFPLEISLNPFTLLQKRYVMAIIVDITERKKSEQTINHWFQVFNESLNEIYIFDAKSFVFINVNRGAQLNLGYSMVELKQMSVLDIKSDLSENNFKKLIAPLIDKTREKVDFETVHKRKDGSTYPVEVHLQLSSIGKIEVFLAIVLDITERKNYTQHLENTVEERTEQLREALKAEKQLNELKTKFLSLVSHEFKTPLSSILTSNTLLSKYTKTDQQEKRDKHINTIKEKVKYLDGILTDFLSIERLDTGKVKYNITSFPLSKIINEVVYNSNTLLKEGQRIQYPKDIDGITLSFDEKILELALSNLLHNAIKYSPEDSSIQVRVADNGATLQLDILDNGLGIPEEDQPFIFERYFRASNVLTDQGTGIGLNIVKQHMFNLGADISFKSKSGTGSTFTLTIPKKQQ